VITLKNEFLFLEMWIAMMSVAEDCSGISVVGHVGGLCSPGIAVDA